MAGLVLAGMPSAFDMSESKVVFEQAVTRVGLSHLWKAHGQGNAFGFVPAGCDTYASFGFCTSYIPATGAPDDKLVAFLKVKITPDADTSRDLPRLRKLHLEAFVVASRCMHQHTAMTTGNADQSVAVAQPEIRL